METASKYNLYIENSKAKMIKYEYKTGAIY